MVEIAKHSHSYYTEALTDGSADVVERLTQSSTSTNANRSTDRWQDRCGRNA